MRADRPGKSLQVKLKHYQPIVFNFNQPGEQDMNALINNFINGNLKDAKRQARNYTLTALAQAFRDRAGYSFEKAQRTANYLKNIGSYQAACDSE
jgi:hypothetical protein